MKIHTGRSSNINTHSNFLFRRACLACFVMPQAVVLFLTYFCLLNLRLQIICISTYITNWDALFDPPPYVFFLILHGSVTLDNYGIHVLSSVLKAFFRDLPEPLMTADLYSNFVWAASIGDKQQRLQVMTPLHFEEELTN